MTKKGRRVFIGKIESTAPVEGSPHFFLNRALLRVNPALLKWTPQGHKRRDPPETGYANKSGERMLRKFRKNVKAAAQSELDADNLFALSSHS